MVRGDWCYTNGPLTSLEPLKNCRNVVGNLHLLPNGTDGNIQPGAIGKIIGCIKFENTLLRNLHFLQNTVISCKKSGGNRIYQNENLCVDNAERETLRTQNTSFNIEANICPMCIPSDRKMEFGGPCKTFKGDLIYNATHKPKFDNLKEIFGRIIFENTSLPQIIFKNDIKIQTIGVGHRPPLSFINTSIPPLENLERVAVNTYGRYAIEIRNIPGWILTRQLKARLERKLKREVKGDIEGEKGCFFEPHTKKIKLNSVLKCTELVGKIILHLDGCYAKSEIKTISSTETVEIHEGDGSILYSLQQLQDIFLQNELDRNTTSTLLIQSSSARQPRSSSSKANIEIHFKGRTCFKEEVMTFSRAWVPGSEVDRVLLVPEKKCDTYEGVITMYDMKNRNGHDLIHVIGGVKLGSDEIRNQSAMDWTESVHKFDSLKTITKQPYIPFYSPALSISMCSTTVKIPDFVFRVNITSYRDDDVVIQIGGPGYKMPVDNFTFLVSKYGRHRIDTDPQHPGDCSFMNPIRDLSELDGCDRIVGDLILDPDVDGETSAIIKQIDGCVNINNTKITNLDFIQFELPYDATTCFACKGEDGFVIKNNFDLCANHWMFNMDADYVQNNKPECGNALGIEAYPTKNIVIHGPFNESLYRDFAAIRELKGKIVVTGSEAVKLDVFPNLEKIEYMGPGPAILLTNNKHLTSFSLPKIKKIKVRDENKAIVTKNNPKLVISSSERELYVKAANKEGKVEVEKKEEPKKDKKKKKKKVINSLFGEGFGYGAIAAGVLVVVCTLASVIAYVIYDKVSGKRKMKTVKRQDSQEQTRSPNVSTPTKSVMRSDMGDVPKKQTRSVMSPLSTPK